MDAVIGDKPQDLKIAIEIEQRVAPPTNATVTETLPIVEKVQDIKANIEQNIIDAYKDKPAELAKTEFYQSATSATTVDVADVKVAQDIITALASSPEVNQEVITVAKQEEVKIIDTLVTNISKPEFQVAASIEVSTSTQPNSTSSQISQASQSSNSIANTNETSASTQVTVTPLAAETLNPVPGTIAELIALKNEVPTSEKAKIDVAINVEVNLIQNNLTTQVNDPVTFQTYVAQIEQNPVVAQTVAQVGGTQFSQAVETKVQAIEVVATQQQTQLQTTVAKVQQEIFSAPANNPSNVEQTFPQPIQAEIQQIKQEVPQTQIPQVAVSTTVTTSQETKPAAAQPTTAPTTTTPQSAPETITTPAPPAAAPAPAAPEIKAPEPGQPAAAPPANNPAPAAPAIPGL